MIRSTGKRDNMGKYEPNKIMGWIYYFEADSDGRRIVSGKGIPEATERNLEGGGYPGGGREEPRLREDQLINICALQTMFLLHYHI